MCQKACSIKCPPSINVPNNVKCSRPVFRSSCQSSISVSPTFPPPASTPSYHEDYPPLPSPLPISTHVLPMRPLSRSVPPFVPRLASPRVKCLVPCPALRPVPGHVPCPVTRPVPVNVRKPVCPCLMSNHTSPLRKLNKVKPPKWEKCEYVHVPTTPMSCEPSPPVPRPVPRHVSRPVPRPKPCPLNRHVPSPVNCPVTLTVEQGAEPHFKKGFTRIIINFNVYILYLMQLLFKNVFNLIFNICLFNLILLYNFIFVPICKTLYFIHYFFYLLLKFKYKLFLLICIIYILIILPINYKYIHSSQLLIKHNDNIFYDNGTRYYYSQTMTGHTDFHHQRYNTIFLSEETLSSPMTNKIHQCEKNWIFLLISILFLIRLKNKKTKNHLFFSLFFIIIIIYILFSSIDYKEISKNIISDLKICTKTEFYTIECVNISNKISNSLLKANFNLLSISKLKYNNHSNFFRYLLLLSR